MLKPTTINGTVVVLKTELMRDAELKSVTSIRHAIINGDLQDAELPGYVVYDEKAKAWLKAKREQKRKPGPTPRKREESNA